MNLENYKKEDRTIDPMKANLYGLYIIIPTVILFGLPYYFLWIKKANPIKDFITVSKDYNLLLLVFLWIFILLIGIVLHELIHGIAWFFFTKKGFKSIKIGVLWKMLIPYCHCKEPLKVKHYIIGAIMPAIVLGFIPIIISFFTGNIMLFIYAFFFIIAAAGDFLIIYTLRKEKLNDFVLDHPDKIGCVVYRKLSI